MNNVFPKHGLSKNTKQRVFAALLARQQGKCAVCGVSQAEIEEKHHAPVHRILHIDHCHTTGMIRGLLCGICNSHLALLENFGFQEKPADELQEDFDRACEVAGRFIEKHRATIFLYMQKERWLPRKDILFHICKRLIERYSEHGNSAGASYPVDQAGITL